MNIFSKNSNDFPTLSVTLMTPSYDNKKNLLIDYFLLTLLKVTFNDFRNYRSSFLLRLKKTQNI